MVVACATRGMVVFYDLFRWPDLGTGSAVRVFETLSLPVPPSTLTAFGPTAVRQPTPSSSSNPATTPIPTKTQTTNHAVAFVSTIGLGWRHSVERIPSVPSAENSSIAKHRKKTNAVSRPGLLFVGISASVPDLPPGTVSTSFSGEYRTLYELVRANESNVLEKRKHRMESNRKDGGCIRFPLPFWSGFRVWLIHHHFCGLLSVWFCKRLSKQASPTHRRL